MLKVIHVVENLDKGAVENWLVNIFIESRKVRPDWEWTFYCILGKKGRLDEKVQAAGGKIIYSPYWISDKVKFIRALRNTLKKGRFDILHVHHDYLSGYYLLASAGIRYKKRILHIHNTDKGLPVGSATLQKLLLKPLKKLAVHFSDHIVGISYNTLEEFTENKINKSKVCTVLYYGIDLKPFSAGYDRQSIHKELNIPEKGKLLLFVGRMNFLKNPVFVVDILKRLHEIRNDVYAVFIGKGEQEELVSHQALEYGLKEYIRILGWRNDTVAFMKTADVFVFPRIEYPKEGLGLVVVEAQAAGLPMVLSHGIVDDAIEIRQLANFIPNTNNPGAWAEQINHILNHSPAISRTEAYNQMSNSRFELENATQNLMALYEK